MRSLPRLRTFLALSLSTLILLWTAAAVAAQDFVPPAHVAVVDGLVTIEREAGIEPAAAGVPLIPGDRLRTTSGRAEVMFPDGSVLDIDEDTSIDLQSDLLLRLIAGRILLTVAGADDPTNARQYQIDMPVASVRTEGPGDYRVSVLAGAARVEGELAVLRGAASLDTERGSTRVHAGERLVARGGSPPGAPRIFNSARFDDFDRWTDARRTDRLGAASTQYLPRDLRTYGGAFDRHGSWSYEPSHGYVWFPAVEPNWRPYYNGYWTTVHPYGWTWVGLDVWAWPTHHYGRWGVSRSRWFWIPDRQWSAAWVSWAGAPGYVSWCPLGFDNRPVFALSFAARSHWAGWVVVRDTHFGPGHVARQYAVASPALSVRTPLRLQASAPAPPPRSNVRSDARPPRPGGTAVLSPGSAAGAPRPTAGSGGLRTRAVPRPATEQPPDASPTVNARPAAPAAGRPPAAGARQRQPAEAPGARSPQPPSAASATPRARPPQNRDGGPGEPRTPAPAPVTVTRSGPAVAPASRPEPRPAAPPAGARASPRSAPRASEAPPESAPPAAPPAGARAANRR